jgi:hypothetical protein
MSSINREIVMKWLKIAKNWTILLLGYGLLAALGWHFVEGFGSRWEFGRHCMPKSLVAQDGVHYLDGTTIDSITLSAVRNGNEEDVLLTMTCVIGLLLGWWAVGLLQIANLKKRSLKLDRLMARIHEKQDQGEWKEAEQLLDLYDRLAREAYGKHWNPKVH